MLEIRALGTDQLVTLQVVWCRMPYTGSTFKIQNHDLKSNSEESYCPAIVRDWSTGLGESLLSNSRRSVKRMG